MHTHPSLVIKPSRYTVALGEDEGVGEGVAAGVGLIEGQGDGEADVLGTVELEEVHNPSQGVELGEGVCAEDAEKCTKISSSAPSTTKVVAAARFIGTSAGFHRWSQWGLSQEKQNVETPQQKELLDQLKGVAEVQIEANTNWMGSQGYFPVLCLNADKSLVHSASPSTRFASSTTMVPGYTQ